MEKNKKVLIKKIEKIFKIIQINQKNLSKERIRKHNQKPEVGTKKLKYSQRPEVKARKREYAQRPEVKAKKQKYAQRPEVKARKRESYQRWSQKNKEKIREYNHRWCQKNKEKMREHTQSPIEWYDTQICKNSKYIKTKYATVIVKQKVDDTIMLSNIVPMPVTKSNEEQEIVHKADIFNVKDLSNGINNIETNMFERPEIPKTPEIIDIILDISENKTFSDINDFFDVVNTKIEIFERPEIPKTPEIIDIILDMSENKIFSNVNGKVISNSI
ncbi:hypothetical protein [Spiroplasma endosymbiont of Monopis laevigella]|uniref:hypothetical protein n=1 Tax=Spiroplasma endosymbiont of Monopis laevigella TaxID=3066312 RepID=UPI0030D1C640